MNLSPDFFLQLAADNSARRTEKVDVLWYVTTFRTNAYLLLHKMGLTTPNGQYGGVDSIRDEVRNLVASYIDIIASFPAEIRYSESQIEQPRANSINHTLEVFNGLQSDADTWNSAQELTRIIATNADSEQQKLTYDILMGIMLRILALVDDVDVMNICADLLQ